MPWIKDILRALRIPVYQADGFEADDVIGTLATKAGQAGVKTFMLTPDKDYGQLVSDNVMMYKPRHGGGYDVIDKTALTSQYGISTPDQVIDLLALMGDSADNFPGCPGVGEKTAVKLINEFGSVDALLQHTDQLKGKMKEKVEGAVDDIKMSKFLATIRTDVPIELKLDEMKVKSPDESELTKIFGELEFKRLLSKFVNKPIESQNKVNNEPDIFSLFPADSQEEDKNQSFQSLKDIAHEYKLIETEEDAQKLCDFLMTKQIVSLDTETTSTNAIDAELVGLSFSVEENKAFYVAIPKDREKALRIVNIFKSLYEEPSILKVGQNIKYDYEVLCNYGVRIGGKMWDTMLAHYIIQPELKHNMDDMAEQLLHYKTIHIEELIGPKGKGQKNMADLKPEEIYEYAAEDADVTLKLKNALQPKLKEVEGAKLFEDIEMPLVPVLADMEMNGVCIDTEALKETSRIFTERMNDYEQRVYTYTRRLVSDSTSLRPNKWGTSCSHRRRCTSSKSLRKRAPDNMSLRRKCCKVWPPRRRSCRTSSTIGA